jgi:hypothetical protein
MEALASDLGSGGDVRSKSRLLEWCISGCVALPAFLAAQEGHSPEVIDFSSVPATRVPSEASTLVAQWLL